MKQQESGEYCLDVEQAGKAHQEETKPNLKEQKPKS